jgi:hypothetical protein
MMSDPTLRGRVTLLVTARIHPLSRTCAVLTGWVTPFSNLDPEGADQSFLR